MRKITAFEIRQKLEVSRPLVLVFCCIVNGRVFENLRVRKWCDISREFCKIAFVIQKHFSNYMRCTQKMKKWLGVLKGSFCFTVTCSKISVTMQNIRRKFLTAYQNQKTIWLQLTCHWKGATSRSFSIARPKDGSGSIYLYYTIAESALCSKIGRFQ